MKWTWEETQHLRETWPIGGAELFRKRYPGRSADSCRNRAKRLKIRSRYRGLNPGMDSIFTEKEDQIIRERFPRYGKLCAEHMEGKTEKQVAARAYYLGVKIIK